MKEAYQLAFQHSNERKIKPGDKVLIRNLSERKRKRERALGDRQDQKLLGRANIYHCMKYW